MPEKSQFISSRWTLGFIVAQPLLGASGASFGRTLGEMPGFSDADNTKEKEEVKDDEDEGNRTGRNSGITAGGRRDGGAVFGEPEHEEPCNQAKETVHAI